MTAAIACYVRVSTADQNLQRQIISTTEYAQQHFDVTLADIEHYRDKSTGTNTERRGYRGMMNNVEAGKHHSVVVHEISRLARSLQDLERTITRVTDAGAQIHFVRDNLSFGKDTDKPMHKLQLQMLGAFAEWEAEVKRQNTIEGIAARKKNPEYAHGRAPLGFDKDDGRLIEAGNYQQVVAVLDMVTKGNLSIRAAAKELGTSRPTIDRSLDRLELYGL